MFDKFTQAYIEAIWFTECHSDNPELEDADTDELSADALAMIEEDCADFQESFAKLLEQAYETDGYDAERAGHDFWLTRNRHGAGFWDRGLGTVGDQLTTLSHPYGSLSLYRGDDGKLHLA